MRISSSDPPERRRHRPLRISWLLLLSSLLHLGLGPLLLLRPETWRWVLPLLVTDHLLIAAAGFLPRSHWLGPVAGRMPYGPHADRVALTFDDGPDPEVTPRVLELLAAAGARASFFLIGERARRHPDLVRAIAAAGHRIENHTWSHPPLFALLGRRAQGREVDRNQQLLAGLAGRTPRWLRTPAGLRNPWTAGVVRRRGLGLAAWSRRGYDRVDGRADRVLARLCRRLRAGDILLLHDGRPARGAGGEPVVLAVLPSLLALLARHGWQAVALEDPDPPPASQRFWRNEREVA